MFGKLRLKVGAGVGLSKVSIERNNAHNTNWLVECGGGGGIMKHCCSIVEPNFIKDNLHIIILVQYMTVVIRSE